MVTINRHSTSPLSSIFIALAHREVSPHLSVPATPQEPTIPVLLIHGIFDSAACWFPVAEELASTGYQVLAVDLPGHGQSPRIDGDFTVRHLADLVYQTVNHEGIDKAYVIGHSLGGLVAQQIAQAYPQLVVSLVLEDPAWDVSDDATVFPPIQAERVHQLATWSPSTILDRGRRDHPLWDERDIAGWFEAKIDVDLTLTEAKQNWKEDTGPDAWSSYGGPVTLITADTSKGAIVSAEQVETASRALGPRLSHTHIQGVGHDIRKDASARYLQAVLPALTAETA